jgi:two-component system, NarL family, nitrate/nitrite response regulator NarL
MSSGNLDSSEVRVGVLAAHLVVRAGVKQMLAADSHMQITHEAASIDEAVSVMSPQPPDVVIVDPDADEVTLHAITQLSEAGLNRVLVFTSVTDPKVHRRAFELGAFGVVLKDQSAETLIRAVRTLHAGEAWLERVQAANLLNAIRRRRDPEEIKIESLTKREHEVIKLVGHGHNSAAISSQLFISEATVRNHLTSILGKLGLSNRFELAVYAFRHRLVELQPEPVGQRVSTVPAAPESGTPRRAAI